MKPDSVTASPLNFAFVRHSTLLKWTKRTEIPPCLPYVVLAII